MSQSFKLKLWFEERDKTIQDNSSIKSFVVSVSGLGYDFCSSEDF